MFTDNAAIVITIVVIVTVIVLGSVIIAIIMYRRKKKTGTYEYMTNLSVSKYKKFVKFMRISSNKINKDWVQYHIVGTFSRRKV